MKLKRMPVFSFGSNSTVSPTFVMLSTFLLCGAVIGYFSASFVPDFSDLQIAVNVSTNTIFSCIIDALKYNLIIFFCIKYLGFLIPIIVTFRGYLLAFSVSTIYANSDVLSGSPLFFHSILNSVISVPCFLIISTICLKIYLSRRSLSAKKSRKKTQIDGSYFAIFSLVLVNFLWNLFCTYIF